MSIFKITASKIKEFFKWGDKADSAVSVGKEAKDAVENYDQDNKAENIKHGIRVAAEIGDAVNPYLLPRQGLLTEGVEPVENAIDTISGREAYLNNQIDQASGYYNHIDDDEGNLQIINPSMPNFLDKEDSKYNEDNNSDKQLSDQDNDDKKSNDNKQPELNEEDINKIKEFIESIENKFKGLLDNKFDWLPDEFKDRLGLNRNGKFHIYDPLVLDLDGDGIKSSTGWVKADDGLLVWDRNGDGIINNGSEIFGEDMFPQKINHTITNTSSSSGSNSSGSGMTVSGGQSNATTIIENDGFYALSQLDSNQDGVIDCNDQNFNQIKVWRDLNQDGISQTGELFTLNELDIQSINLNTGNTKNNTAGNSIGKSSTYTKTDGSNGKIADINFTLDTVHSEYIEHITIGEEQMLLPYLHGVGKLRDLREAATLSPELTDLLQQYQLANQKEQQTELLDNLMLFWARTNNSFHEKGISFAVGAIGASGIDSTGVTPSQACV